MILSWEYPQTRMYFIYIVLSYVTDNLSILICSLSFFIIYFLLFCFTVTTTTISADEAPKKTK